LSVLHLHVHGSKKKDAAGYWRRINGVAVEEGGPPNKPKILPQAIHYPSLSKFTTTIRGAPHADLQTDTIFVTSMYNFGKTILFCLLVFLN
jgi:hypothetical protein